MLFTFAEYFLQINFISLDALSRNSEQIKLSEFLKRNKKLFSETHKYRIQNSLKLMQIRIFSDTTRLMYMYMHFRLVEDTQLSYWRESARRFLSLNIFLSHSRSFETTMLSRDV